MVICHAGVHAAGTVITKEPVIRYAPLAKGRGDVVTTQYDGEILPGLGILKVDFLGLRTLSTVELAKKLIRSTMSPEAVLRAVVEVGRPTLFSMLIIITAHIPIFTLQRHEGRIFAPMAYSVTSALIGSLIISLTLVPLLCLWMLRRNIAHGENPLMVKLKSWYAPVLRWALARRRTVLGIAGAALLASLLTLPLIPLIVSRLAGRIEDRYEKMQAQLDVMSERARESFSGAKVVKSFAREEGEVRTFARMGHE